jgi:antitoxin component YwqK of YwqJK toxin-antitoxin module
VRQFDMRDTLMVQGSYKDSMMTIPNGRFFYYNKYRTSFKTSRYIDTNSYLKFTGFFLNGAKTGQWIEYFKRGVKGDIYTFENNKLNGLFQNYNTTTGNVLLEGNYVNDMKEGEWNTYTDDPQNPAYTDIYMHDKLSKKIVHLKQAMPPANYDSYVRKALKPYMDSLLHKKVIITILLNEQGIVENINQNKTMTPVIDRAIADAFLKSPKFQPSLYDNKQLKGVFQYDFGAIGRLKALQDAADQVINQKNVDILSRHADDIGRGLNNMG